MSFQLKVSFKSANCFQRLKQIQYQNCVIEEDVVNDQIKINKTKTTNQTQRYSNQFLQSQTISLNKNIVQEKNRQKIFSKIQVTIQSQISSFYYLFLIQQKQIRIFNRVMGLNKQQKLQLKQMIKHNTNKDNQLGYLNQTIRKDLLNYEIQQIRIKQNVIIENNSICLIEQQKFLQEEEEFCLCLSKKSNNRNMNINIHDSNLPRLSGIIQNQKIPQSRLLQYEQINQTYWNINYPPLNIQKQPLLKLKIIQSPKYLQQSTDNIFDIQISLNVAYRFDTNKKQFQVFHFDQTTQKIALLKTYYQNVRYTVKQIKFIPNTPIISIFYPYSVHFLNINTDKLQPNPQPHNIGARTDIEFIKTQNNEQMMICCMNNVFKKISLNKFERQVQNMKNNIRILKVLTHTQCYYGVIIETDIQDQNTSFRTNTKSIKKQYTLIVYHSHRNKEQQVKRKKLSQKPKDADFAAFKFVSLNQDNSITFLQFQIPKYEDNYQFSQPLKTKSKYGIQLNKNKQFLNNSQLNLIKISPNRDYVVGAANDKLCIWNIQSRKLIKIIDLNSRILSINKYIKKKYQKIQYLWLQLSNKNVIVKLQGQQK